MTNIKCKLFSTPKIVEDGEDIFIPVGKLSGLLYYIILKKVVSRDEVAGMFWPTSNEQRAKISLRNAIHKIRKSFKEDVILSPNKTTLILNENINFIIDVEEFERDPEKNFKLYDGEFLNGFYVKEAVNFEYWVIELRTFYREKYINTLSNIIKNNYNNNDFNELEKLIDSLLNVDPYNEEAYEYLFKFYKKIGRNDKIINEYYDYQKSIKEDLGIEPSYEIKKLYEDAIASLNKYRDIQYIKKNVDNMFFNREYEIKILSKNIEKFINNENYKSFLIEGEYGIGKTQFKKIVLKNIDKNVKVFETKCYAVERNFSYSPWIKIINFLEAEFNKIESKRPEIWEKLADNFYFDGSKKNLPIAQILEKRENVDLDIIYTSLVDALDSLSNNKKIIISIEDIQWADKASIKLLTSLMLHSNKNLLFIITKSNENADIDRLFGALYDLGKLKSIKLRRFDRREVAIIIKKSIKNKVVTEEIIDEIYDKSKGNPLFLREYIDIYKKNGDNSTFSREVFSVLEEKFSVLSENEREIINVISIFYVDVNIDKLLKLVDINPFEVVRSLNNLIKLDIIEEKKEKNKVYLNFINSLYKDYIYKQLSDITKQVYHNEIAKVLEEELLSNNNDIRDYIKIKYHYEKANDGVKTLKYEVYILNYYLNFSHELFPNLDDYEVSRQVKLFIKNDRALKWINNIENEILKIKNSINKSSQKEEIEEIELLYLYCKGRYLIRCGSYSEGVKVINRVIEISKVKKDERIQLQGHKQMVIYSIQVSDRQTMLKNIKLGIEVSKRIDDSKEIGVLYRLYGVYYQMEGDFIEAENYFKKSIDMLSNFGRIENTKSISIAANYNYIGEIRSSNSKYKEAMMYFKKAIELCGNSQASCLSIFYINAGKTSFLMGNINEMKEYFNLASKIVDQFDSYWKSSVLDAFLGLINCYENKFESSLIHLKNASIEAKTINNPRDIGTIYYVKAIMKKKMEKDKNYNKALNEFLDKPVQFYYYQAIKYLDPNRDKSEINYLKNNII